MAVDSSKTRDLRLRTQVWLFIKDSDQYSYWQAGHRCSSTVSSKGQR